MNGNLSFIYINTPKSFELDALHTYIIFMVWWRENMTQHKWEMRFLKSNDQHSNDPLLLLFSYTKRHLFYDIFSVCWICLNSDGIIAIPFINNTKKNDLNSFRLNGGYKLRPEMLSFQSDLYFNEGDIAVNADKFVRTKKSPRNQFYFLTQSISAFSLAI